MISSPFSCMNQFITIIFLGSVNSLDLVDLDEFTVCITEYIQARIFKVILPSTDSFKKGCCQLQAKVCAPSTG